MAIKSTLLVALFSLNAALFSADAPEKAPKPLPLDQQFGEDDYETEIFSLHEYYGIHYAPYGPTTVFSSPYYMTAKRDSLTGNTIVTVDRGGMNIQTDERTKPEHEVSMLYLDTAAMKNAFLCRGVTTRISNDSCGELVYEEHLELIPLLQDTIHFKKHVYHP